MLTKEQAGELDRARPAFEVGRAAELEHAQLIADVVDLETGEVLFEANELAPRGHRRAARGPEHAALEVFFPDWERGSVIANTLAKDATPTPRRR